MSVKGTINCGVCGFTVEVVAEAESRKKVKLEISSNCKNYQKLAEQLKEVNAFEEIFPPLGKGEMFRLFASTIPHPSCPGLSGILKTIEVATGLALPQNVSMEIKKSEA